MEGRWGGVRGRKKGEDEEGGGYYEDGTLQILQLESYSGTDKELYTVHSCHV